MYSTKEDFELSILTLSRAYANSKQLVEDMPIETRNNANLAWIDAQKNMLTFSRGWSLCSVAYNKYLINQSKGLTNIQDQ